MHFLTVFNTYSVRKEHTHDNFYCPEYDTTHNSLILKMKRRVNGKNAFAQKITIYPSVTFTAPFTVFIIIIIIYYYCVISVHSLTVNITITL